MRPTAAIICFTQSGAKVAEQLMGSFMEEFEWHGFVSSKKQLDTALPQKEGSLADWTKEWFGRAQCLVFVGACGIAVRAIAPFVQDKFADPAVLVIDEQGKFCISLLSGHVGGANEWAEQFARVLNAQPVITTATDLNRKFAVDVFAKKNELVIADRTLAKEISAAVLRGEKVSFRASVPVGGEMPSEICADDKQTALSIRVGVPEEESKPNELWLIPRNLVLGIGCRKGTPMEVIEQFVLKTLKEHRMDLHRVCAVASIDLKRDEAGLVAFCEKYAVPFVTYSAEELSGAAGEFAPSAFVQGVTGVDNVCERSAVLHVGNLAGSLVLNKQKGCGVTLAAAEQIREYHF